MKLTRAIDLGIYTAICVPFLILNGLLIFAAGLFALLSHGAGWTASNISEFFGAWARDILKPKEILKP